MESVGEMDALVAKAMGWHEWITARDYRVVEAEDLGDWDSHWACKTCGRLMQGNQHYNIDPPSYSTDIAAAFSLTGKLDALLGSWALESDEGEWNVWKTGFHDALDGEPIATAPTAPLAICMAILKLTAAAPAPSTSPKPD